MSPNQELEETLVLEGPYPVRRWEGRGHRRVMSNILPTIINGCTRNSAPVYEEDTNIDFITVLENMEAFFLLGRYFRGAGAAGYPSSEPSVLVNNRRASLRETVHPNN